MAYATWRIPSGWGRCERDPLTTRLNAWIGLAEAGPLGQREQGAALRIFLETTCNRLSGGRLVPGSELRLGKRRKEAAVVRCGGERPFQPLGGRLEVVEPTGKSGDARGADGEPALIAGQRVVLKKRLPRHVEMLLVLGSYRVEPERRWLDRIPLGG